MTRRLPHPDEACTYCTRCPLYTDNDDRPWAKHFVELQIGECCAVTQIRECFKNDGVVNKTAKRFGLKGSFWDYARAVFNSGPDSKLGRWFIKTYLEADMRYRVDLLQGPDRGDWEFRVVEIHPEPYADCGFFGFPIDVEVDMGLIMDSAQDAVMDPSKIEAILPSKRVQKLFGRKT